MDNSEDEYRYEVYGEIRVAWQKDLEGGGRGFGQRYVEAVRKLFGRVERVHEFCAGPGFIGFALMAEGLCDTLCLSDINPRAIDAVKETIRINGLQDRVSVYESDVLQGIPEHERWDLVIANPPCFNRSDESWYRLRTSDPGWRMHCEFYQTVRPFLKPHGSCFILESYRGSTEETFIHFIEAGGLSYIDSIMTIEHIDYKFADTLQYPENHFFFVWSRIAHDDFLRNSVSPWTPVRLVLTDRDSKTDAAVKLDLGRKYAITTVNERSEPVEAQLAGQREYASSRWLIPTGESGVRRALHTLPGGLVETQSGRMIAEFVPVADGSGEDV